MALHYPDKATLERLLPNRTKWAIRGRAATLKLQARRDAWTTGDVRKLRALQGTSPSPETLLALFPGRTVWAIQKQMRNHKVPRRKLNSSPSPVMAAIRAEAHAQGMKLVDLDRATGSWRCFSSNAERCSISRLEAAAALLGLGLRIRWEPVAEGD